MGTFPFHCCPHAQGPVQTSRSELGRGGRGELGEAWPPGVREAEGLRLQLYSSAWALPRNLLLPRGVQAERPWARLRVRVYRAEGLPTVRSGLLGSLTRALHDQHVLLDPYVRVSFLGQQVSHPCPPRPQLEPFKKYLLIKDNLS